MKVDTMCQGVGPCVGHMKDDTMCHVVDHQGCERAHGSYEGPCVHHERAYKGHAEVEEDSRLGLGLGLGLGEGLLMPCTLFNPRYGTWICPTIPTQYHCSVQRSLGATV